MKEELLQEYARLIAKVGANVQEGQYVVIRTDVSQEKFAALVSNECYKLGAKRVFVHWQSAKLAKVDYNNCDIEEMKQVPSFVEECHKFMAKECPILIWLDADDPDGLHGVDSSKVAEIKKANQKVLFKYREAQEGKAQWCIAGIPSIEWARRVFPKLDDERAMDALLQAILMTARVEEGKSIDNWNRHEEDLKKRCSYLNSLNLRKLHYTSTTGTDFTVGLIPGVIFQAGAEKTIGGVEFQPNMPTEECFTSPMKGEAEGIVIASKPLVYNGKVIEDFSVRFHEGKAVEVHSKKNEDTLRSILDLDEGSAYLGECALVPYHSPINQSGILFFNTLYDENAACHLALGRGFVELVPGFEEMSKDEIKEKGINSSSSHVDFMIGDEHLKIIGITDDNREVKIFENGDWAF